MSPFTDKAHIFLVWPSITDFQSVGLRIYLIESNKCYTLPTNFLLTFLLITIAFWLPQINAHTEKVSPYECGFDPTESACLLFSMNFFLIAITFLLFDLEIALPLLWASQVNNLNLILLVSLILVLILTLGPAYEWTQKGLEWTEYAD